MYFYGIPLYLRDTTTDSSECSTRRSRSQPRNPLKLFSPGISWVLIKQLNTPLLFAFCSIRQGCISPLQGGDGRTGGLGVVLGTGQEGYLFI